ncbi:hypothetical protein BHE74_00048864, partial [Ensete ventricosum]
FIAKPSSAAPEVLFLGFQPSSATTTMVDQMKKGDEGTKRGTKDKQTSIPPSTDRDRLVQFLSNLSASTEVNTSWRSSLPGGFDLTVSQLPPLGSLEESTKATGNENATSATTNLLTVLLAALAASAPDAPASLSQLTSGSPIAVVGWQKSSLVLEGRNLIVPGTKSREVVLHFRNELGWLFQRTHRPSSLLSFA